MELQYIILYIIYFFSDSKKKRDRKGQEKAKKKWKKLHVYKPEAWSLKPTDQIQHLLSAVFPKKQVEITVTCYF